MKYSETEEHLRFLWSVYFEVRDVDPAKAQYLRHGILMVTKAIQGLYKENTALIERNEETERLLKEALRGRD